MKHIAILAVVAFIACNLAVAAPNTHVDSSQAVSFEKVVNPAAIIEVVDFSVADTVDPPDPLIAVQESFTTNTNAKQAAIEDAGSFTLNSGHLATWSNATDTYVAYSPPTTLIDVQRRHSTVGDLGAAHRSPARIAPDNPVASGLTASTAASALPT